MRSHAFLAQITALGNPKLLERVAAGLTAIRNLFSQFDTDMNNVITREEFSKVQTCGCMTTKALCVLFKCCIKLCHLNSAPGFVCNAHQTVQ